MLDAITKTADLDTLGAKIDAAFEEDLGKGRYRVARGILTDPELFELD